MNSGSIKKSNFLGDTVESKYTFLDLGKQFEYDREKDKKAKVTSTKAAELSKDNVKQHMMYSGGFKMMELPNKNKKNKDSDKKEYDDKLKKKSEFENKFDYSNYFPKKDDIYSKLGIRSDEVEEQNVDPDNELDQLQLQLEKDKQEEENNKNQLNYVDYNFKFGINKDDFYSTDDPSVQAQFREKLLGEIETKVNKLHSKRDLLNQRKDHLKIIEKKQKLKIHRDAEEQLNEKQKQALYKNVDEEVDDLIHQKWLKKNPELNQVEDVIDKHRQKMKELEQLYYEKKLNQQSSQQIVSSQPLYMEDEVLHHLVEGRVDLDNNHKKSFRTLNNKLVKTAKYTHRQIYNDDDQNEDDNNDDDDQIKIKKQMVGSFDGDMYDFQYHRNNKKDARDYEQMKQDEQMEIIVPKRQQKQFQEQSPKRNKPSQQQGLAYLSDTSQSFQIQKIDRQREYSNKNEQQSKQLQQRQQQYQEQQQKYQQQQINKQPQKINQDRQNIENQNTPKKNDDSNLENKKQQTLLNEKERKLQILREEMSQIDKLMQEPGVGVKKVYIQPSEKAIDNVTHIPIEKKIYQQKYEEYLVDKKIKENTETYFKKMTKPEFERVKSAKSFEKYKQLHPESDQDYTITDRPIELKKTYEDIIKDEDDAHLQQYSEQIEKGKRSTEEKRMKNLYTRIISDNKQSLNKRKQKDDDFILKFLFMQIDTAQSGFVSAQEIFDSLKDNKDAIVFFDLCVKTLFADLDKFKTARKGLFNIQEFSQFVINQNQMSKKTLQSEKENLKQQILLEENPNLLHKLDKLKDKNELFLHFEQDPVNTYGTCVLNEAKLDALREIFGDLDPYNDYIVKRLDLINEINKSEKIKKILSYPAVKIPIVNRKVTLQSVLEQIEKEYTLADDQQKKSKEYISWNQFFEYFKNYSKPSFILSYETNSSNEAQQFDISEDYLLLIQDIFDMIPRVSSALDYVSTADFIIAAKKDPQIRSIQQEIVRMKSEETGIDQEDLSQTLDRILSEGGDYIQWHEVKLFFSRRGKPFTDEYQQDNNTLKQDNSKLEIQQSNQKNTQQSYQVLTNNSPKKLQTTQQRDYDDDNQYYGEDTGYQKKYDMFEQQKKIKKPNAQEEVAKLRLEGNYDSEDEEDYMQEIQEGSDEDLQGSQYNQLKELDFMRNGGVKKHKKTAEEEIKDHYSKKRVLMKPQNEDKELQEEINEFDKHYKELMKRQQEAQLGPLESLQQKQQQEDPVKYGMLKHTAVDYDKYFGQLVKHKAVHEKEQITVTVPKPFQFDQREATKQKSIYQMKKDQYLQEVMNRDEEEMKKRFKANPIPTTTKVPMFNNIMEKNKEKREKVRQESIKILQESEQPFSFYEKDIQKREEKKQKIVESISSEMKSIKQKTFKANEIPASSKVEMIKQMEQEREENRKKRIEERKEEQLKSVKEFNRLAGASEQWKETLKKRETTKTWEEEKCTFAPKVNKVIPETSKKTSLEPIVSSNSAKIKAMSAFTGLLNKKPQIEAEPFNLQPGVPKPTNREHMDDYNNSIKADKLKPSNLLARLAPSKKKASEKQIEEIQQSDEQNEEDNQEKNEEEQEENNQQEEEQEQNEDDAEKQSQPVSLQKIPSKAPSQNNIQKKLTSQATIAEKEKKTTKAEQLLIKAREEEKKKKEKEELQKKKEQEEREKKLKDRAGEVRDKFGNPASAKQAQEEMEKQKLKERQEIAKQQKLEYQQQIKDMEDRVKNKQLLTQAKHHGSSALDKYRKMKPSETNIESQQQIKEEEQEDIKQSNANIQGSAVMEIDNISRIDTKKDEHAEDNYEEEFDNNKNGFDDIEENASPAKNEFDDISD